MTNVIQGNNDSIMNLIRSLVNFREGGARSGAGSEAARVKLADRTVFASKQATSPSQQRREISVFNPHIVTRAAESRNFKRLRLRPENVFFNPNSDPSSAPVRQALFYLKKNSMMQPFSRFAFLITSRQVIRQYSTHSRNCG